MMIKFKDLIDGLNHKSLEAPTVSVDLKNKPKSIHLKFNTVDVVVDASYSGQIDPWLGMVCEFAKGKSLTSLTTVCQSDFLRSFGNDQLLLDFLSEHENEIVHEALELLKAAIHKYQGREYLYSQNSSLVCRCFGVRENDIISYLQTSEHPTLEELSSKTKAAMGCRSCLSQIKRWLVNTDKDPSHYYKEKTRANWLIEMDYMLSCFPDSESWKMAIESFQGQQVIISYDREISQTEFEEISVKLQDFLGPALDADLSFFLIRSRQRSNASG